MSRDNKKLFCDFVDYLLPELTPPETSLYFYLLRHCILQDGSREKRVGKRTMADGYGRGSQGKKTTYANITKILKGLEEKGCIKIGDTNVKGTLYFVIPPSEIPLVIEKIAVVIPQEQEEDYFTDPQKRQFIFERDKWICQYCGEKVTQNNATLDHYVPQSKGGQHHKENLRTSCLICNGVKSGKSFEEAAPVLLKSIQERKQRSNT